jgi:excisionase family DNA binding protein
MTATFAPELQLLTQEETAIRLGLSPKTLEKWRVTRRYRLPFVKVGGLVRYTAGAVEEFIRSRTVTPGEPQQKNIQKKNRRKA